MQKKLNVSLIVFSLYILFYIHQCISYDCVFIVWPVCIQQEAVSIHSTTCLLSRSLSTARYAPPFPILVAIAFLSAHFCSSGFFDTPSKLKCHKKNLEFMCVFCWSYWEKRRSIWFDVFFSGNCAALTPLVELGSCRSVLKSCWISKCFKVVVQWTKLRQLSSAGFLGVRMILWPVLYRL